ncbi:hypothetical protein [Paludibaculum fermentans]|uniref:hypothetical protein n=1 Tax=Paludibaculum fermentans TaxID=1473598 RepID=UPI003EB9DB21
MRSLLAAMAAVAMAFFAIIAGGFWIHEHFKAPPDSVFGFLAALSLVIVAFGLYCLFMGTAPWKLLPSHIDIPNFWSRQRDLPPPKPYVRPLTPEQEAYSRDPFALATCLHLQPIERAMRTAGLAVRLEMLSVHGPTISVTCRIHQEELVRYFNLPDWIYYREGYEPERSQWDNPRADIFCGECMKSDRGRCDILVLHPDECRQDTPWFPSPPPTGA